MGLHRRKLQRQRIVSMALLASLLLTASARAEVKLLIATDGVPPQPKGNSATEPLAKSFSLQRAAEFLDGLTVAWINQRKCGSCHTGNPYLFARAQLDQADAPAVLGVRKFFENRVVQWDEGGKGAGYIVGKGRLKDTEGLTEVVTVASALAMHDQIAGKLHPLTRRALGRMWEVQREDGSWPWNRTGLAPMEHDEYFGVVSAAVAVGNAPEGYAQSPEAEPGLARLRKYLQTKPAPDLHHKLWLLWASAKLEQLVSPAQRAAWVEEIHSLQRADGGWSLHSLGDWKRRDDQPVDKAAPIES